MSPAKRYELTRTRLLSLLEEMKANSIEVGSLCVPPGSSRKDIEEMIASLRKEESTVPEDLPAALTESQTGGIVFWGPHHRYLVIPPFPVTQKSVSNVCEIEPLHSLMHRELLVGLVMVRLGDYGIGVIQSEKLLAGKTGSGVVHARHRQGGSSSNRFRRHREKQMETFFTRVCEHAREQLEPYAKRLDYLLYGGTKETVLDFRKQCRFMHEFDKVTLDRLLNVRDPKKPGLEDGIQEAWSSRVIQWD